jgi:AraC family transcriptional regulator
MSPYHNPAIHSFLRGASRARLSSGKRGWSEFALEDHEVRRGELAEAEINCYVLLLWQGPSSSRGELLNSRGSFVPYSKHPGTLTLYPPGPLPPVRLLTTSNLLLCALDTKLIRTVSEQMRDEGHLRSPAAGAATPKMQPSFQDASLQKLLLLLREELLLDGFSAPLYAEHLAHALAMRLCSLARSVPESGQLATEKFALPVFRRIIDRLEATPLERYDIASLAAETGYSSGHFLRSFRATTGLPPHQFIIRMRLERARRLMLNRSRSLLDIALESGFSSHSHFSRAFRHHYGVSPSSFRRAL